MRQADGGGNRSAEDAAEPSARRLRQFLREPVSEIADAARYLDAAVTAHLHGRNQLAEELFRLADMPEIREWAESLWGKSSPYVQYVAVPTAPPALPKSKRVPVRMPTAAEKQELHGRDGYHCRFCGIPVIRTEIRQRVQRRYPEAVPWGRTNVSQHAAFQAMWLQYDHFLPHARGGDNSVDNILITCAPCNYARGNYTIEELGLMDPRQREPLRSMWDGLERFK